MIPDRYNFSNLKRAFGDPSILFGEIRRTPENVSKFALHTTQNAFFEYRYGEGEDFMKRDWDNLIILDACRYDVFASLFRTYIDGDLHSIVSKGAHSWEFMKGNFVGKELHDTVYTTGNAHTSKLADPVFHSIQSVDIESIATKPSYQRIVDDFDAISPEESYAVFPETVASRALESQEYFPKKRHVVHFMQPHTPYLGKYGLGLYQDILEHEDELDIDLSGRFGDINIDLSRNFRNIAQNDAVPVDENTLRVAYAENLKLVLDQVDRLADELDGRTVITADHGEQLGEKALAYYKQKTFGHPHLVHTEALCKVPWVIVESEERREVVSELPTQSQRIDDDDVGNQLRALGYKE